MNLAMDAGIKATHDLLLAMKPEGAAHDELTCPLCKESVDNDHPGGGSMSDKTYTEDQLKAAVDQAIAEATASLQSKVSELQNSQQQSEMDKAIAAAKAEKEQEIADLQAQLDAAVLDAQKAKDEKAELEATIQAEREAAEREARREERLTKLKEEAGFPEDFLEKHADRFVAMTEEDFAARLEEYVVARGKKSDEHKEIPETTALHAARTEDPSKKGSALSEIRNLRSAGIHPARVSANS